MAQKLARVSGAMSTAVFANTKTRELPTHGQDRGVDGGLVHRLLSQIPRR